MAHVLDGREFFAYLKECGQDVVLAELNYAIEHELDLSNTSEDYLEDIKAGVDNKYVPIFQSPSTSLPPYVAQQTNNSASWRGKRSLNLPLKTSIPTVPRLFRIGLSDSHLIAKQLPEFLKALPVRVLQLC